MEIVYIDTKDIKPYKKNPRQNKDAVDYVANSIKEFGFKVPVVLDKDNVVVCGHTRLKAAKKLKIGKIPCVIAKDLSEAQIKAFRLADNKVSEAAEWDMDLLSGELAGLIDFDMSEFGFEMDMLPDIFANDDEDDEESEEKENERQRTIDAYNLDEFDEFETEGFYQMPKLEPTSYIPKDLIGFNYALSSENKDCGIHFYVDDYQFERVWNDPQKYMEILQEYDCILTPDFSLYTEMPIAMKIWNTYRSRLIGQIAQRLGIQVIPTVSWCERDTFDFCFDGLPKRATLSISTIGVKREDENFSLWKNGVDEMIKRLEPKTLIVYGGKVDYDYGNIKVVYVNNKTTERMANSRKKKEEVDE